MLTGDVLRSHRPSNSMLDAGVKVGDSFFVSIEDKGESAREIVAVSFSGNLRFPIGRIVYIEGAYVTYYNDRSECFTKKKNSVLPGGYNV